jgi:hypothetical protein
MNPLHVPALATPVLRHGTVPVGWHQQVPSTKLKPVQKLEKNNIDQQTLSREAGNEKIKGTKRLREIIVVLCMRVFLDVRVHALGRCARLCGWVIEDFATLGVTLDSINFVYYLPLGLSTLVLLYKLASLVS